MPERSPIAETRARREAIVAGALALAVVASAIFILPKFHRNPLAETTLWSLLLVVSFAGWGSLVRFFVARHETVDLGLRAAWGASLVCAIGGALMVPALMTRGAALALVEVGLVLALVALWQERSLIARRATFHARFVRRQPRLTLVLAVAFVFLAISVLGAVADNHTNPYDDEIAYLAFVKKLLDTGTVIEPFSFRRLSALGGQTLFLELTWLRAGAERSNAFDRGVCVIMLVLLVAGFRRHGRRVPLLVTIAALGMLLTLPLRAINTASYYSGAVFFLALFRTLVWASRREAERPWTTALPLALVAVTACTLRQNYLPVPVVILAASYVARLVTAPPERRATLVELAWTTGLGTLLIAPWLVQSWQSNRTILYPFMGGTFNPALALKTSDPSILREIKLEMGVFLDGIPVKTLAIFALAAAFVKERDPRRPLGSLGLGAFVGFVLVVHAFSQSDAGSIGRYVFSSAIASVLAVVLVTTTDADLRLSGRAITLTRQTLAAALTLFATFGQLVAVTLLPRDTPIEGYGTALSNIGMLWRTAENRDFDPVYDRMQAAIPAGERAAVLLDRPFYLSFRRNPIWNLDMPGYSSLAPGLPFFKGTEAVEQYFASIGVRYLAFVRPNYSTYHYRREYWIQMLADETELWRSFAPYLIDFLDNLTAIEKRHPVLFDERGLVVVDLGATTP